MENQRLMAHATVATTAKPSENRVMTDQPPLSNEDARDAVQRLVAWKGIAGSDRLRGLVEYLATETLAGRGDDIRAKTIALDHYGYAPDELVDRESVVRVDAGRLRRRLDDYYRGDGVNDPVRLMLPKGSYRPIFERASKTVTDDGPDPGAQHIRKPVVLVAACALIGALGIVAFLLAAGLDDPAPDNAARTQAQRTAAFEASPARLQAINLAESGRDLIFPAVDPERLRAALIVFDAAIEADADYAGGHAGAAQVLATMALLAPEASADSLERASRAADRALTLAPIDAWSQEARAWVDFAGGDCDAALDRSARAMALSPLDPHIVEFESLISLFCGKFDRVVSETEAMLATLGTDTGFVFSNALGSARFHLGDDRATIAAFEDSIARGGPTGPISLAYLMAANHRLQRTEQANQLVRQMEISWPGNRVDLLFERMFHDPAHARDIISAMRAAGWSAQ